MLGDTRLALALSPRERASPVRHAERRARPTEAIAEADWFPAVDTRLRRHALVLTAAAMRARIAARSVKRPRYGDDAVTHATASGELRKLAQGEAAGATLRVSRSGNGVPICASSWRSLSKQVQQYQSSNWNGSDFGA